MFSKKTTKEIFRRLTQLKNRYLLEPFFGVGRALIANAPEKEPDCE
jgi:hypothetical protein